MRNCCSDPGCSMPVHSRGLCRAHYAKAYRSKAISVETRPQRTQAQSFLDLTIEVGRTRTGRAAECVLWPFTRDRKGYATIAGHASILAARIVCEAVNGPAPPDAPWALHNCDHGADGCIEPTHLEWGNAHKNNVEDRKRNGTYEAFVLSRGRQRV